MNDMALSGRLVPLALEAGLLAVSSLAAEEGRRLRVRATTVCDVVATVVFDCDVEANVGV